MWAVNRQIRAKSWAHTDMEASQPTQDSRPTTSCFFRLQVFSSSSRLQSSLFVSLRLGFVPSFPSVLSSSTLTKTKQTVTRVDSRFTFVCISTGRTISSVQDDRNCSCPVSGEAGASSEEQACLHCSAHCSEAKAHNEPSRSSTANQDSLSRDICSLDLLFIFCILPPLVTVKTSLVHPE